MSEWKSTWTAFDDSVSRVGGQGRVIRVRRNADGVIGALKELHLENQNVRERRARLAREVTALETISGAGVPKVLDHNMAAVQDKSIPLYYVAEWIPGETLSQYVNGRPRPLAQALEITRNLAEIVKRCHEAGVSHRDIKPDNIIIDSPTGQIFLVDFGTAWLDEGESGQNDFNTEWGQELGNRFLRIPDLSAGRDRSDMRIDLVFVVGILFYLITGRAPRVLTDERLKPPHISLSEYIPNYIVSSQDWSSLRRLFDVGFQPSIDFRFQSASEILQRIDQILSPPDINAVGVDPQAEIAALKELLQTRINETIRQIESALQDHSMTLIMYLRAQADLAGLENERSAFPQVETGRSIRVFFRLGQQYPVPVSARLNHQLTFTGEANTYVEASFQIDTDSTVTYYRSHASDTDSIREVILKKAPEIFGLMVRRIREATEEKLIEG